MYHSKIWRSHYKNFSQKIRKRLSCKFLLHVLTYIRAKYSKLRYGHVESCLVNFCVQKSFSWAAPPYVSQYLLIGVKVIETKCQKTKTLYQLHLRGPRSIFTFSLFLIEENVSYQEIFRNEKNIVPNLSYHIFKSQNYIQ